MAHREFRHPLPGVSRLAKQGSDPQAEGNSAARYPKADATSGYTEEFSQNSNGDVTQLTGANAAWTVNPSTAVVALTPAAGSTTALTPTRDTRYEVTPAGACTLTLPAIASVPVGRTLSFKYDAATPFTVTLDGSGGETIDGSATRALMAPNHVLWVMSNGTEWKVVGNSVTKLSWHERMAARAKEFCGITSGSGFIIIPTPTAIGNFTAAHSSGTEAYIATAVGVLHQVTTTTTASRYALRRMASALTDYPGFVGTGMTTTWYAALRARFTTAIDAAAYGGICLIPSTGAVSFPMVAGVSGATSTGYFSALFDTGAAPSMISTVAYETSNFHTIEVGCNGVNAFFAVDEEAFLTSATASVSAISSFGLVIGNGATAAGRTMQSSASLFACSLGGY